MSRLPKNVFDSPFKKTAEAKESASAPIPPVASSTASLAVMPDVESPKLAATVQRSGRKQTVYLTDEQILGLNVEIFEMRRQGKTAREANLTKVIAAAVDYYLARAK